MSDSPFNFKVLSSSEVTPMATPDNLSSVSSAFASFSPSVLDVATAGLTAPHGATPLRNSIEQTTAPTLEADLQQENITAAKRPLFGRSKSDAVQRRDIEDIVLILRRRPGAISELGIERIARNNSLEVFKDDIDGGKRISLGGRIILIDIDLLLPANKVTKVALSLASMLNDQSSAAQARSDVLLLADLQTATLDAFARNVERLARHDKLSTNQIDNFQVLDGLYKNALQRIHEYEIHAGIDAENMGHGTPAVDDVGVLGLSIWYWNERHKIPESLSESERKRYRVIVEIGQSGRTGGGWGVVQNNALIGEQVATSDGEINWQEPDYSNLEDQVTSFVLKLDPPVAIPYYDAAILDPEGEAEIETIPTFNGSKDTVVFAKRAVYDSRGQPVEYVFSLTSTRVAEMRKIEEVYLSHPRQIFSVFEILRQSIRMRALIHSVFKPNFLIPRSAVSTDLPSTLAELVSSLDNRNNSMAQPESTAKAKAPPTKISVTLTKPYGHVPRVTVIMPTTDYTAIDGQPRLTSFAVDVARGGKIGVAGLVVNEHDDMQGREEMERTLEHVIDVAEDLGIVAHWVREQVRM
ncbi:mediator of RNA polymerase II transcription subunit 1-domain-containing protein [Lipomyces tetrasporus]|uniref:Mediator of RNA polymerase II transcription subunit 1 n=1 Tax=Lipomyces tetrasporus TaxID=54092 RepID=A0AAD7QWX6_9ASCO|nr:mediator of RNA polymerase II transcription subunit 1-domain-containing protein [Lipomyces tetrasporus]KAJ8102721.1 mediator of RNA polymerase II transcription subunit 1-domain-containing protein [Lipomyces tetrasporus]